MVPEALASVLVAPKDLTIALSGGIDSLTLSAAAAYVRGPDHVTLCHAVSPAVPAAATARVKHFASERGLTLRITDAGEFADEAYRANPINRCYFCKSNLYGTLSAMADLVAAGTNLDDLSDYRPGLLAADEHSVLHPFVTARMTKQDVRSLARTLGLGDLAELPAAPCLASRIETGLRVEPAELRIIDAAEVRLREMLGNVTLRCRRMRTGWVIEIGSDAYERMSVADRAQACAVVEAIAPGDMPVTLRTYERGSAFVHG